MNKKNLEIGKEYPFDWNSGDIAEDLEKLKEDKEFMHNSYSYPKTRFAEGFMNIISKKKGIAKIVTASCKEYREFDQEIKKDSDFREAGILEGLAFMNSYPEYDGKPLALLASGYSPGSSDYFNHTIDSQKRIDGNCFGCCFDKNKEKYNFLRVKKE